MLEANVAGIYLRDLSPYGSFPIWSLGKVTQPVRIEPKCSIYDDIGQIAGPVGVIHVAHYPDTSREVFTEWSGGARDFSNSVFLNPGRTGNKLSEIRHLIVNDPTDQVPASLKDDLRSFDKARGWQVVEAATLHS